MTLTGILTAIVVGTVVGLFGKLAAGRNPVPTWLTVLTGVLAGLVGVLIAYALFGAAIGGVTLLITQVAVAAAGVGIAARVFGRRARAVERAGSSPSELQLRRQREPTGPPPTAQDAAVTRLPFPRPGISVFLSYRRSDTGHAAQCRRTAPDQVRSDRRLPGRGLRSDPRRTS